MITLGVLAPKNSAKDPDFGQVSLLLHGNGTSGSQVIVDSSLNNFTVGIGGNAQLSNTQAKFGSCYLCTEKRKYIYQQINQKVSSIRNLTGAHLSSKCSMIMHIIIISRYNLQNSIISCK